jgi:hypothetical protein
MLGVALGVLVDGRVGGIGGLGDRSDSLLLTSSRVLCDCRGS